MDFDNQNPIERTLLEHVADVRDSLSASERKVASWVLENPVGTAELNLAGLANAASVSEPTVVRFCTAVGVSGFRTFKLALVRSLALGDPGGFSPVARGDSVQAVVSKTVDRTINALHRTRNNMDTVYLEQAADWLSEAREILFIGAGSSGIVALDAQQKFPVFGVPCFAPVDFHEQFMAASMATNGTVLVAISNSARTKTVVDVARVGKRAGAKVIAIVGDSGPLSRVADLVIRTSTFEDTEIYTPTVSRIAGLVVIDVLANLVTLRQPQSQSQRLLAMKEALARAARHY
jgi:RpiR family carbohydrate utilization transcriptional regulator